MNPEKSEDLELLKFKGDDSEILFGLKSHGGTSFKRQTMKKLGYEYNEISFKEL